MIRSLFRVYAVLAVAALSSAGVAFGQGPTPPPTRAAKPSLKASTSHEINMAFANADIADVANAVLGDELGLSFVIDPAVSGKMSFRVSGALGPDQLMAKFESALSVSDIVIVRNGSQLVLTPRTKAKAGGGIGSIADRGGIGFQVRAVPIRHANASDVAKSLEAIGPAGLVLRADDKTGEIILSGTAEEIQRAIQTIAVFDRGGLDLSRTRLVTLKSGSPKAVADDVSRLIRASGVSGVELVPLDRLRAIVIVGRSADTIDRVKDWIDRLDLPSHEEPTALWIFRPRNASADSIAQALTSVNGTARGVANVQTQVLASSSVPVPPLNADGQRPTDQSSPLSTSLDSDLKIGVDKEENALLVMAPEARWLRLKAIFEDLDRSPDQILIQATVLEVSLDDEFRLGVDWSVLASKGRLNLVSTQDPAGAVAPTYPGFELTYMNNTVRAVVDALAGRTRVQVMSAPKLVTLDNRPAQLQVGDQVPIVNQSSQGTVAAGAPLIVTTEYRDTGVILKVKPRINGPNSVVVDLTQEVSSVARTTTSTINSPTIQERKFSTVMTLHEGEVAALGGLISTNDTTSNSGAPYLQNIPILGSLFKTTTNSKARTEIVVLLTAKILTAADGAQTGLAAVRQDMKEIKSGPPAAGR